MSEKMLLAVTPALIVSLLLGGCAPSDAQIASEMEMGRMMAYQEWKAKRDSGADLETRADGPLSLDDAIKLALQYNKALMATVQTREITRGGRISSWDVVLPSLTGYFRATRRENRGRDPDVANRGPNIIYYSAGLTVTQPVFDKAMIPTLTVARLNTALTDERIRSSVQGLVNNVALDYYKVLLAQKLMETYQEGLVSAQAQYRVVAEKKRQETATEYDVLRAQVDVAKYQADVQSAKNSIDSNRVTLLKDMGVSQDSNIVFSDQLVFLPMRPVFERAVEMAVGLRPDLRIAALTSRIDCEAIKLMESAFWPTLTASFSQTASEHDHESMRLSRDPWTAMLSLSYTLGIRQYGDLVAARATARQSALQMLDTQDTALMEIRMYMNNLANAEESVRALEVNQTAAREALRLVEVGYQAGVKTEVDVTDARKALTDVIGQYYQALYDHTVARLNLQIAMGVLGPVQVVDGTQMPPSVPVANIEEFAAVNYVPPQPPPMPEAAPRPPRTTPSRRPTSSLLSRDRDSLLRAPVGDSDRSSRTSTSRSGTTPMPDASRDAVRSARESALDILNRSDRLLRAPVDDNGNPLPSATRDLPTGVSRDLLDANTPASRDAVRSAREAALQELLNTRGAVDRATQTGADAARSTTDAVRSTAESARTSASEAVKAATETLRESAPSRTGGTNGTRGTGATPPARGTTNGKNGNGSRSSGGADEAAPPADTKKQDARARSRNNGRQQPQQKMANRNRAPAPVQQSAAPVVTTMPVQAQAIPTQGVMMTEYDLMGGSTSAWSGHVTVPSTPVAYTEPVMLQPSTPTYSYVAESAPIPMSAPAPSFTYAPSDTPPSAKASASAAQPKPMFKVKVRERAVNSAEMPEVANSGE